MSMNSYQAGAAIALFTIPFVLFAGPSEALTNAPEAVLADGSRWVVNINGSTHSIRLHNRSQPVKPQVKRSGRLRLGISNKHGKGLLVLNWRGNRAAVEMTIPLAKGESARCTGEPANDLSFLSGTCDIQRPFIMTAAPKTANITARRAAMERTRRAELAAVAVAAKPKPSPTPAPAPAQQVGAADARDIALRAAQAVPSHSQGGGPKADSVNILDVPLDPGRGSLNFNWLAGLLNFQADTIRDLFNTAGRRSVNDAEDSLCNRGSGARGKSRSCSAIFRQHVITLAVAELRDNR